MLTGVLINAVWDTGTALLLRLAPRHSAGARFA